MLTAEIIKDQMNVTAKFNRDSSQKSENYPLFSYNTDQPTTHSLDKKYSDKSEQRINQLEENLAYQQKS